MTKRYWGTGGAAAGMPAMDGFKLIEDLASSGSHRSSNHIYLYSEITPESILEMVTHLRETVAESRMMGIEFDVPPPPVHLHINSQGGDVFAGLSAMDTIIELQKHVPIHTHIEGFAASAATLISMAGSVRTIGRNSFILIHQISSEFWGKYEEWKVEMRNKDMLMQTVTKFYEQNSKMTGKAIRQVLKQDLWFPSDKALELGLVDEVRA
jgi:ATP-dependent protease ClpP protease subunit